MKMNRQYNALIDLEYFLDQDVDVDNNELHRRDRNIYLECRKKRAQNEEPNSRELILFWLEKRIRRSFPPPDHKSPGTIFGDAYFIARNILFIAGIISGLTGGFSFFTYTGTTPVNVFLFLLLFVVSQLALVAILAGALLLRFFWPGLTIPSFYGLLLRKMMARIVSFFHRQWLRTAPADKRLSINQILGIFKSRGTVYGHLFYWPLFTLCQLFAIGFNLGLLTATFTKISTSDIAFGWQSTLQFSAEAIHRLVATVALPWSWFVSAANSYPSLAEIEGSRIILKEGIYHLTTADLIAWWPFLVFCILFYGLFVRLVFLAIGKIMERRSLHNLQLDTPACQALMRRMQTPLVTTQAAPETARDEGTAERPPVPEASLSPSISLAAQVVLLPDDIYSLCPADDLANIIKQQGFAIAERHRFMVDYDRDQQLKQLLAERSWRPGEAIFILMEGWMVPLVDFLSYLKQLRAVLPDRTIIHLGLVGRPGATVFTPVEPADLALWRQKVEALGDPYLNIFPLIS